MQVQRKKWNAKALTLGMVALLLTSCLSPAGPKEEAGMIIGGVLGGILGSQADGDSDVHNIAIIAGTMLGAAIGGSMGRYMDDTDRLRAGQTLETVRSGVSSTWRNPDTGYNYRFTPTRTYERTGRPCREYTINAQIGGSAEEVYGTACRQPDGAWRVQG